MATDHPTTLRDPLPTKDELRNHIAFVLGQHTRPPYSRDKDTTGSGARALLRQADAVMPVVEAHVEPLVAALERVKALHQPVVVPAIPGSAILTSFTRCSCKPGLLYKDCPTAAAIREGGES